MQGIKPGTEYRAREPRKFGLSRPLSRRNKMGNRNTEKKPNPKTKPKTKRNRNKKSGLKRRRGPAQKYISFDIMNLFGDDEKKTEEKTEEKTDGNEDKNQNCPGHINQDGAAHGEFPKFRSVLRDPQGRIKCCKWIPDDISEICHDPD